MIGLTQHKNNLLMSLVRGAVLGLLVSFAFYSAVAFQDVISFLAGIVYGVIIEAVAFKYRE
jgi:hypothetical protein